jgi:hypothetical protein
VPPAKSIPGVTGIPVVRVLTPRDARARRRTMRGIATISLGGYRLIS